MISQLFFASQLAVSLCAGQPVYQRKTVLDFSQVQITGQVVQPNMTLVNAKRKVKFRPLIRNRGDFRPELFKSLEQL